MAENTDESLLKKQKSMLVSCHENQLFDLNKREIKIVCLSNTVEQSRGGHSVNIFPLFINFFLSKSSKVYLLELLQQTLLNSVARFGNL